MLGHTIAVRKAPSGTLFAATTVPTIATSAATQISADNNLRTIPAESGRSSQTQLQAHAARQCKCIVPSLWILASHIIFFVFLFATWLFTNRTCRRVAGIQAMPTLLRASQA